jgi:F-type H+-transporting ATPase subunit b
VEALELLGISGPMVVLQAIPFLVVLVGLNQIIFQPVLKVLAEREKAIHGFSAHAGNLDEEVAAKMTEIEARIAAAKAEANAERARLRDGAAAEEQAILDAAKAAAEQELEAARVKLAGEVESARAHLADQTRALASQVAGSVLGRAVEAK